MNVHGPDQIIKMNKPTSKSVKGFEEKYYDKCNEVRILEEKLSKALTASNNLINHFHRFGLEQESFALLMEVESATQLLIEARNPMTQ